MRAPYTTTPDHMKPCPLCGSSANLIKNPMSGMFAIHCGKNRPADLVRCIELTYWYSDVNNALKVWNDRPIEDDVEKIKQGAKEIYHLLPKEYKSLVLDEFLQKIGINK